MMNKRIGLFLGLCILSNVIIACQGNNQQLSTPIKNATIENISTHIITEYPTITNTVAPTNQNEGNANESCKRDNILRRIKAMKKYNEISVAYQTLKDFDILFIWFVDPTINPFPVLSEVQNNSVLALRDASILVSQLSNQDDCITSTFTTISIMVVDKEYYGWLSGTIETSTLLRLASPSIDNTQQVMNAFNLEYIRNTIPIEPKKNEKSYNCTWTDAVEGLYSRQFDPSRENTSFHFVIDDIGAHVYAQWDTYDYDEYDKKVWWGLQIASVFNVMIELECLSPVPSDLFFYSVDRQGKILFIGAVSDPSRKHYEISLEEIKVIYLDSNITAQPAAAADGQGA